MAVKVGNKYICNIPEAVSKLIEDVEALKDQTAGTKANVYKLIIGQAFDEELFNKMKAGDIVIVNNIPFVVIKLENKIEGYYVSSLGGNIIYGTILKIEWEREDILKFNAENKLVKDLSFIQTDIKAKSLETINDITVGGKIIGLNDEINVDGNLEVNGTLDGTLKQGPIAVFREGVNVRKDFEVSRRIGDIVLYQLKVTTTGTLTQGTKFADFEYHPSSIIFLTSASIGGAIRSLQINTDGTIENIQEITNNYTLTYFAIIQIQN